MKSDVVGYLAVLERYGEDNIWRTARAAREEIERLRELLARYRDETPMGNQPPMIAHLVDEALGRVPNVELSEQPEAVRSDAGLAGTATTEKSKCKL